MYLFMFVGEDFCYVIVYKKVIDFNWYYVCCILISIINDFLVRCIGKFYEEIEKELI